MAQLGSVGVEKTHRMFRIAEVSCDLQSLDAFFLFALGHHFGVLARLQKNVHSAERALLRFVFFMRKIAKFCCDLERFPDLGTNFRKTKSCGPIVGNSSRRVTRLSGMLRFGVRFSRRTF